MEIFVWKALETMRDRLGRLAGSTRKFRANRRARRLDRRRSVNEGVFVTLSTRAERRHNPDRRHIEETKEGFAIR